mmetsp:Transcript_20842/g.52583  ORF Transcript_20842/g.52583 Transcript_20842/m.52583 type:complete len:220 (+) Transcript_20842:409-1068(+)
MKKVFDKPLAGDLDRFGHDRRLRIHDDERGAVVVQTSTMLKILHNENERQLDVFIITSSRARAAFLLLPVSALLPRRAVPVPVPALYLQAVLWPLGAVGAWRVGSACDACCIVIVVRIVLDAAILVEVLRLGGVVVVCRTRSPHRRDVVHVHDACGLDERIVYVLSRHCRRLDELQVLCLSQLEAFVVGHLALLAQVAFVAHERYDEIRIRVLARLPEP